MSVKGYIAPSAPGTGRASADSRSQIQTLWISPGREAVSNCRSGTHPGPELQLRALASGQASQILRALERTGWKIHGADGAAALLHLKPSTLSSRVKAMGLSKT